MTVYIDDMDMYAEVPNGDRTVRGKWRHLFADSHEELEQVARRAGLAPGWIQHPGTPLEHYDVTGWKVQKCIAAGAQQVTWGWAGEFVMNRKARAIQQAREEAEKNHQSHDVPEALRGLVNQADPIAPKHPHTRGGIQPEGWGIVHKPCPDCGDPTVALPNVDPTRCAGCRAEAIATASYGPSKGQTSRHYPTPAVIPRAPEPAFTGPRHTSAEWDQIHADKEIGI